MLVPFSSQCCQKSRGSNIGNEWNVLYNIAEMSVQKMLRFVETCLLFAFCQRWFQCAGIKGDEEVGVAVDSDSDCPQPMSGMITFAFANKQLNMAGAQMSTFGW